MSGRARLPGGEPTKKTQRNARPAAPKTVRIKVQWKDRGGIFRRALDDGEHAEVVIGERAYRVRIGELG